MRKRKRIHTPARRKHGGFFYGKDLAHHGLENGVSRNFEKYIK
jgi:hypothetical protein